MKTIYRYYCLYRPPMPGSIPSGSIHVHCYDFRQPVPESGREAWGYAEYTRELSPKEIQDYELAFGGKY